ncbi:MAG: hypothetical protein HS113_28580 [Verrucomicrobiales bacterium]|nr:hypothetical protein [Verrucomicrobiales bacterium]
MSCSGDTRLCPGGGAERGGILDRLRPAPANRGRPDRGNRADACHGGDKLKGGFRISTREDLLKGGQSGEPAIVPGRGDQSPLLRYVRDEVEDLEMPPLRSRNRYPALSPEEANGLERWISSGAPWPPR